MYILTLVYITRRLILSSSYYFPSFSCHLSFFMLQSYYFSDVIAIIWMSTRGRKKEGKERKMQRKRTSSSDGGGGSSNNSSSSCFCCSNSRSRGKRSYRPVFWCSLLGLILRENSVMLRWASIGKPKWSSSKFLPWLPKSRKPIKWM